MIIRSYTGMPIWYCILCTASYALTFKENGRADEFLNKNLENFGLRNVRKSGRILEAEELTIDSKEAGMDSISIENLNRRWFLETKTWFVQGPVEHESYTFQFKLKLKF